MAAANGTRETMAVILAGGKGTRLRPLTAVFPKPLVPLGNKPIIEILLRQLQAVGLTRINICTGYLAELIMAVCGDGSKYGLEITYTSEESPLGTAAPLAEIQDLADPFIVMNGDLLTTLNFGKMMDFHVAEQADITVGVFQRDIKIDFGVVDSNEQGEFLGFREKPTFYHEVSMGVNVIGQGAMQHVVRGEYLDMPDLVLKVHENGGKVALYREEGCYWLDIGRMDDYALAQEQFEQQEGLFLGGNS